MISYPNAKINLGLNVVEKRLDGFHNIETIFYPVMGLKDVLEIIKSEDHGVSFSSSGIEIPGKKDANLCVDAYNLLKNDFNITGVKIHLHKIIPIGAGLGGGSSDAAFTLIGLNDLFDLKLSENQLVEYAKKLGSDCAFFILNKPVYAFNKGDEFENIELDLSNYDIQIEYPNIHVGTAEAYAELTPQQANKNLKELVISPINQWKEVIKNDFEVSIFNHHPSIKKIKEKMYHNGAIYAAMSGSGSAVFGIFLKEV